MISPCDFRKGFYFGVVMKKYYTLNYLSEEFYNDYNETDFPEIEQKSTRPYIVLLIKINENTFAIPFRTNVKHNYCYKFKNSNRDSDAVTGLDFTKAVIIAESKYIGSPATIDNKEYVELSNKYHFIISKFKKYVDGYLKYINGNGNEFDYKKYKYSTLKYFHKQLLESKEFVTK